MTEKKQKLIDLEKELNLTAVELAQAEIECLKAQQRRDDLKYELEYYLSDIKDCIKVIAEGEPI